MHLCPAARGIESPILTGEDGGIGFACSSELSATGFWCGWEDCSVIEPPYRNIPERKLGLLRMNALIEKGIDE